MPAKHNSRLALAIFTLSDRPQGMRADELAEITGQAVRAAQKLISRNVKSGLLHPKLGREDGLKICRYFNSPEKRDAFEFPVFVPRAIRNKTAGLPKCPAIAADVLECVAQGINSTAEISQARNRHLDSVSTECKRLFAAGELFRAQALNEINRVVWRYFLTQAEADRFAKEYDIEAQIKARAEETKRREKARNAARTEARRAASNGGKRNRDYSEMLFRRRRMEEKQAMAKKYKTSEGIITDKTVITIAPRTWEAKVIEGGFSKLKPGQYLDDVPASTWVRAVAA